MYRLENSRRRQQSEHQRLINTRKQSLYLLILDINVLWSKFDQRRQEQEQVAEEEDNKVQKLFTSKRLGSLTIWLVD